MKKRKAAKSSTVTSSYAIAQTLRIPAKEKDVIAYIQTYEGTLSKQIITVIKKAMKLEKDYELIRIKLESMINEVQIMRAQHEADQRILTAYESVINIGFKPETPACVSHGQVPLAASPSENDAKRVSATQNVRGKPETTIAVKSAKTLAEKQKEAQDKVERRIKKAMTPDLDKFGNPIYDLAFFTRKYFTWDRISDDIKKIYLQTVPISQYCDEAAEMYFEKRLDETNDCFDEWSDEELKRYVKNHSLSSFPLDEGSPLHFSIRAAAYRLQYAPWDSLDDEEKAQFPTLLGKPDFAPYVTILSVNGNPIKDYFNGDQMARWNDVKGFLRPVVWVNKKQARLEEYMSRPFDNFSEEEQRYEFPALAMDSELLAEGYRDTYCLAFGRPVEMLFSERQKRCFEDYWKDKEDLDWVSSQEYLDATHADDDSTDNDFFALL